MNIKDWLREYQKLKVEADAIKASIRELSEEAQAVRSPAMTGMPHSGRIHDLSDVTAKIDAQERRHAEKLKEALEARERIVTAITHVEQSEQRTVLYLRYICGYSWTKIANRMHYADRYVYTIHGEALKSVQFSAEILRYI